MKTHNTTQTLRCKMNAEELAIRAKELSEKLVQKTGLENELAVVSTKFKTDIKLLESSVRLLADKVHTGYEDRLVDVSIEYDFDKGVKSFVRKDTGEIFKTDAITAADRQQEFNVA